MFGIAMVIWIIIGAVLAGSAVVAVLSTPLADHAVRYLPLAGIVGYAVALPVAFLIARRLIKASTS